METTGKDSGAGPTLWFRPCGSGLGGSGPFGFTVLFKCLNIQLGHEALLVSDIIVLVY